MRLPEIVTFKMVIGGEIDGREGNIAEETGRGTFVESHETEVTYDPHGGAPRSAFNRFGDFALDLEADFDNFQGVGEDLTG